MMMKKKLLKKLHSCPECASDNLVEDYDQGEIICETCGLVISEQMISTAPEWRAFTKEEHEGRSRTGAPTSFSMYDKGLSTVMKTINKDVYGKSLSSNRKREMLRLRTWHNRVNTNSSKSRNLIQAMADIDRFSDKLHLPPSIKERAAIIYRKALDSGLVRGRSIAGIALASLYAACRTTETPRTLKECAEASGIKRKDIARCYRLLLKELEMKMPVEDPAKCISKISAKSNIPMRIQMKALNILREAKEKNIVTGKDPMGLAAAALYVACVLNGEKKTQNQLAKASNVTEVTVRNRYKNLKKVLHLRKHFLEE